MGGIHHVGTVDMNNPKSSVTATWKEITWKSRALSTVVFNITYLTWNEPLFHEIPEDVTPRALICAAFTHCRVKRVDAPVKAGKVGCGKALRWETQGVRVVDTKWTQGGRWAAEVVWPEQKASLCLVGGVILRGVGVTHGCESWTMKKVEHWRLDAFKLRCWRRLLRAPWTARRSNQSVLKEINPEYSLEGLMLKLKLQYFGHLMQRTDSLEKTLMLGRIEGRRWGQQRLRWFDGIMTQWTWTWANSGRWWRTGKPGVLQSMGSQSWTWLDDWTTRRRSSDPLGTIPLCVATFHWHTPSLTSLRCQAPNQLCDFAGATHLPGHFSYPRLESWTNVTCGLPSNSDYLWIWLWDF